MQDIAPARRLADAERDIASLIAQQGVDQAALRVMEDQAVIDQALIEHLRADGVIDRDEIGQLQVALASARHIGAAVGIVMERYQVGAQQAFNFLVRISTTTNVKLKDVAAQIVGGVEHAGGKHA